MELVFRSTNKMKDLLSNTKDKFDRMENSGIYKVHCGDFGASYIGQTKRTIIARYKEHLSNIKNNNKNKSAIAEHALEKLHFNFNYNTIEIKKKINNASLLDAYESFYIYKHIKHFGETKTINTEGGNIKSILFNCIS